MRRPKPLSNSHGQGAEGWTWCMLCPGHVERMLAKPSFACTCTSEPTVACGRSHWGACPTLQCIDRLWPNECWPHDASGPIRELWEFCLRNSPAQLANPQLCTRTCLFQRLFLAAPKHWETSLQRHVNHTRPPCGSSDVVCG